MFCFCGIFSSRCSLRVRLGCSRDASPNFIYSALTVQQKSETIFVISRLSAPLRSPSAAQRPSAQKTLNVKALHKEAAEKTRNENENDATARADVVFVLRLVRTATIPLAQKSLLIAFSPPLAFAFRSSAAFLCTGRGHRARRCRFHGCRKRALPRTGERELISRFLRGANLFLDLHFRFPRVN